MGSAKIQLLHLSRGCLNANLLKFGIPADMKRLLLFFTLLACSTAASAQSSTVYVDIVPSFVTNYDEGARLKYLKTSVSLKVFSENEESVRHHMPSIKNSLILLFSSQAEENLTSTRGREILRQEALGEIKRLMATLEISGDEHVDSLYFTNFVVQQ
jgi:flagellar FliL protein